MSRLQKNIQQYLSWSIKTDEFVKYKSKLIDSLKSYNAEDLAVQISMSVNMPRMSSRQVH